MNLVGMTLYEAELAIAEAFEEYYNDTFVKLTISNRRVFVLGSVGGRVITLPNENTGLMEVLATSGGLQQGDKSQNIKVIRGKEVFQVDLSTVSGFLATNMTVEPGDVIYVEPWRRPWQLTLRDISPVFGFVSSTIALYFLLSSL